MHARVTAVALLTALSLAAPAALAGPRDIAIHVTRIGGDGASAQPFVDRFLRVVEKAVGWPAASMKGAFLASRKEAQAYVDGSKPGIGIVDPPLYFEQRAAWNLVAIGQIESKELVSPRLNVVVKDPALKTLADLKGKRLWTPLADFPRYLSKVVLDGALDASAVNLKPVGQALKGVRGVLRGDCDATILDDDQLASAKQISGGADLRVIHASKPLPAPPVVLFGTTLPAADRDALLKALGGVCATPEGAAVCTEMHIGRFAPLDKAVLEDARKRFGD
jgi:hypothetical protein